MRCSVIVSRGKKRGELSSITHPPGEVLAYYGLTWGQSVELIELSTGRRDVHKVWVATPIEPLVLAEYIERLPVPTGPVSQGAWRAHASWYRAEALASQGISPAEQALLEKLVGPVLTRDEVRQLNKRKS